MVGDVSFIHRGLEVEKHTGIYRDFFTEKVFGGRFRNSDISSLHLAVEHEFMNIYEH